MALPDKDVKLFLTSHSMELTGKSFSSKIAAKYRPPCIVNFISQFFNARIKFSSYGLLNLVYFAFYPLITKIHQSTIRTIAPLPKHLVSVIINNLAVFQRFAFIHDTDNEFSKYVSPGTLHTHSVRNLVILDAAPHLSITPPDMRSDEAASLEHIPFRKYGASSSFLIFITLKPITTDAANHWILEYPASEADNGIRIKTKTALNKLITLPSTTGPDHLPPGKNQVKKGVGNFYSGASVLNLNISYNTALDPLISPRTLLKYSTSNGDLQPLQITRAPQVSSRKPHPLPVPGELMDKTPHGQRVSAIEYPPELFLFTEKNGVIHPNNRTRLTSPWAPRATIEHPESDAHDKTQINLEFAGVGGEVPHPERRKENADVEAFPTRPANEHPSPAETDVRDLADQVYTLLERKIQIEKERRGL